MVDYNFFEGFKKQKVKKSTSVRLFNVVFLLLMISLATYVGFNYYQLNYQKVELKELNKAIAEASSRDDIARINEKKILLDELEGIVSSMDAAAQAISRSSIISEDLLLTITDALPSDVSISSVDISESGIVLSGTAISKPAIAVFEYNLRRISYFESIFIHGIETSSSDEGAYTFSMSIEVGGNSHENE